MIWGLILFVAGCLLVKRKPASKFAWAVVVLGLALIVVPGSMI